MTFEPTAQNFQLEIMFSYTTQLVGKDIAQCCSKSGMDLMRSILLNDVVYRIQKLGG